MMIGLSAVDPCLGYDPAAFPKCGDPACDPATEQCCPGTIQPKPPCHVVDGKLVPVESGITVLNINPPAETGGSATRQVNITLTAPPAAPGIWDGLKAWSSPGDALSLFSSLPEMFSAAPGAAVGLLLPPLAAVAAVLYYINRKGR